MAPERGMSFKDLHHKRAQIKLFRQKNSVIAPYMVLAARLQLCQLQDIGRYHMRWFVRETLGAYPQNNRRGAMTSPPA